MTYAETVPNWFLLKYETGLTKCETEHKQKQRITLKIRQKLDQFWSTSLMNRLLIDR